MSLLTPMKNIRVASLAGGSPYNHECYKFIPCPSSTDIQDFTDILSKFSSVLSHFGRVWLNYKPEHRRADSLCLLNKIHEDVAAELSNDDLLVRKEWFCIRAFFTCMKNSVDYDPQEEAKLSLQAYRATGASDHGSPPGSQFLINTQVSKWLHESAPAAYMFSRGGRPWDRDIFVESSNPLYNYDPNDDQVLIDAPPTPPPPQPHQLGPAPPKSALTPPLLA